MTSTSASSPDSAMSSSTLCARARTRSSSLYLTNMHGSLVNSMYALVTRGSLRDATTFRSDIIFITIEGLPMAAFTAGSEMTASTCAGVSDDTSLTIGGPSNDDDEGDEPAASAPLAPGSPATRCSASPCARPLPDDARFDATDVTDAPIHSPAPAMFLPTSPMARPAARAPSIVACPTATPTEVMDRPAASRPFRVSLVSQLTSPMTPPATGTGRSVTLTLSARRRRGAAGVSSAPKFSSSSSSSRSTSRESSTAPSDGVNARLAAASFALSPRQEDPGRKSDIDWLHAYTLIAPAAMLVKSACVAPSHIGPQTTTATRRAVSRANARPNARSAISSTSPGFNSTVFAVVSDRFARVESPTTRAASTAAASASRSASTPASVTDRIARIARRRSSEVESTSDLHTAASIRAPASSRSTPVFVSPPPLAAPAAAALCFRSRSSSAAALARSSRLRTSTLRSLVSSVASSASDPSAPAHTANAAATTLGSNGDSPASKAQTKAVRNLFVKCAACAARGPGTVHDRKNPAAYSNADDPYRAVATAARSDPRCFLATSKAPPTPSRGKPSSAVRRKEPRDARDASACAASSAARAALAAASTRSSIESDSEAEAASLSASPPPSPPSSSTVPKLPQKRTQSRTGA
mmetsp:Transcript_8045/g.35580  ORF Transcript_8045/g.35580 Transcript_8045/m.35580 type:complete len:642 (+) Transcript_8045:386-2311(+)